MKYLPLFTLSIILFLNCSNNDSKETKVLDKSNNIGSESLKDDPARKVLVINDNLLYNYDIWKIDKEYEHGSTTKILDELKIRVLQKKDTRSLNRLSDLASVTDGYLSEYYSGVMGDIFKSETNFFLLNTYKHKNAEKIYRFVIFNNYMYDVESKKYPKNYEELKSYSKISNLFLKTYNIYMKKGF